MSILSFNHGQRDHLLRQAETAHRRRHFREAYDFLREALRFGENADIFHRAATILNEMGEYPGAAQVARYALKADPSHGPARIELVSALERLWQLDEALTELENLGRDPITLEDPRRAARVNHLLCLCHLKRLDLVGAQRASFRGADRGVLPEPMASRVRRLAEFLDDAKAPPSLRDRLWIMHGHHLLPTQGDSGLVGMSHPTYADCARALRMLKRHAEETRAGYRAVFCCEPGSLPVALAAARCLGVPPADTARLASSDRVLLCLASNSGRPGGAHRASRHDLFILAKNFEREEYHDVVTPPHHAGKLTVWAEPIPSSHHQIIGLLGELAGLPWEAASIKSRETMRLPSSEAPGEAFTPGDTIAAERIAARLMREEADT